LKTGIKSALLTTLVLGIAEGLIPALLIRNGLAIWPPALNLFSVLGIFFILLGLPIQIWVAWAFVRFGRGTPAPFDPPKEFVATGLFRFVRNPMYYGALCVLTGWVLLTRSMWMLAYAAFLITALHFFTVLVEEPQLRKRFGEPYEEYCQKVPRWIPRFNKESLP
jgi:protein-S-isoprenylcysteine O-methyltransferase Ste14